MCAYKSVDTLSRTDVYVLESWNAGFNSWRVYTVRVKKNLPYRRYERPFIWCVVTKERSSNGPPTLNAVVRSARQAVRGTV